MGVAAVAALGAVQDAAQTHTTTAEPSQMRVQEDRGWLAAARRSRPLGGSPNDCPLERPQYKPSQDFERRRRAVRQSSVAPAEWTWAVRNEQWGHPREEGTCADLSKSGLS